MFNTIERFLLGILGFVAGMMISWIWTIYEANYSWFEITETFVIINMIFGGIVGTLLISKLTKK